jgi:glutaredoxin 3
MAQAEIYTTASCAYCVAAKNFLKQRGLDYSEIRVDREPGKLDEMQERTGGQRSVPQVFVCGELIGGYDELIAADRSGRLRALVDAANERRSA